MFKKALAVTDLSDSSHEMIERMAGLKSLHTEEILLVRCFNPRDVGGLEERLMEQAEEPLAQQKKELEAYGFQVQTQLLAGIPQHEVNRLSKETGCSLIIVGEQRHTLAGEILFDETAGAISHHAEAPVLVLRLHAEIRAAEKEEGRKEPPDLLGHILAPTDFSQNAAQVIDTLKQYPFSNAQKITLLHVQNTLYLHDLEIDQKTLDEFSSWDQQRLQERCKELRDCGIQEVNSELLHGSSPKREILRRLEKGDISMVILGTQGHGWLSELLLGSVSHAVARHSEVPTLLIPSAKE